MSDPPGQSASCEVVSALPPPGSVERWAYDYIHAESLAYKFAPPAPPTEWARLRAPLWVERPGRPADLRVVRHGVRTPGSGALRDPGRRAGLLHTFFHHELQAAELMCRAVLAFPDAPPSFRQGLIGICCDEIRHMNMYAEHIEWLGHRVGEFPVNDWFWQRVPAARTPQQFVAVMGLGFEGANLDHTQRFAARFRKAGDPAGARLQEHVGEEEIGHVAFGVAWFSRLGGGALDFAGWSSVLPSPLSPMLMRGRPINRGARLRAGYPPPFVAELTRWQPVPPGS